MKIVAFGDIHMDYAILDRIPRLSEADLVIITGDLTNFGGRHEAAIVLDAVRRINPTVLALLGNLDRPSVDAYLDEAGINLHGRGVVRGELGIFGVGGSNPTPFNTPTEYPEEELARLVRQGYGQVVSAPVKVLVSHPPPHGTATDRLRNGAHVGSTAIREFIEAEQPHFCLTGHIHESREVDTLGDTLILNPGMLGSPGWIELERKAGGNWTARLN